MTDSITGNENLDDSVVSILIKNGIKSFEEILSKSKEGLSKIGALKEDQIEQLIRLARSYSTASFDSLFKDGSASKATEENPYETETEDTEEKSDLENSEADDERETEVTETDEEGSSNDLEHSVDELHSIDPDIVQKLKDGGFQTLAELSITPEEELVEIDGIDETIAKAILLQATQHTDSLENAS